jgi:hypothetical protein
MRGESFKRHIVEAEITKRGLEVWPNRTLKGEYKLT